MADCMSLTGGCLILPEPGHVLGPYVKVTFEKSGIEVTVGNNSSPDIQNHAIITDFEFGNSDGVTCRVTIMDEAGSSFVNFMEDMLKNYKCTANPVNVTSAKMEFGWIKAFCPDSVTANISPTFYLMVVDVICNFGGGKFTYEFTCVDISKSGFDVRYDKTLPKMCLTDAIRTMLTDPDYPPAVTSVDFLRWTPGGSEEPIKWKFWDCSPIKGPFGNWPSLNLDKLNTAKSWLRQWMTDRDKAVIPAYDATVKGGKVIFWEDRKPQCGETAPQFCKRKYIVNGGKMSPVLDFQPKFKFYWHSLMSSAGVMGSMAIEPGTGDYKNPGILGCNTLSRGAIKSVGGTTSIEVSENMRDRNGSTSQKDAIDASSREMIASKPFIDSIEADLVLVGDPTFSPKFAQSELPIQIVFLNPFHIFPAGACAEWLAFPKINDVLSNKAWRVKQCTHRIQEGKFTTTLSVYLAAPGVDIDVGEPFGGSGSCGWQPPSCN